MPQCYFLPGTGEIRSSADWHPVGRKNLIPKRDDVGRGPPGRAVRVGNEAIAKRGSVSQPGCSESNIVVVKLGGSVLTGVKAFRRAALFLKSRGEATPQDRYVVVVSAQKGLTDTLERRARNILRTADARALDLLWSTGELRSVALLSLHLQAVGVSSVGLNVHEAGLEFTPDLALGPAPTGMRALRTIVANHAVVIVPGFFATRPDGAIVSLNRGGSDLTAVLLAIGLDASRCELIKDVPGYFERDPREDKQARHLASLSFEEALRMADRGCQLVQRRAISVAAEAKLPLVVRSLAERARVSVVSSVREGGNVEARDEVVAAQP
jgi:aspartokinase